MSAHSKGEVQVLVNKYIKRTVLRQLRGGMSLVTIARFAWHAGYRAGFRRGKRRVER